MEQSDVKKLIQLRNFVIERYTLMDGKETSISVQPTKEVAMTYESIIRSIEDVLSTHVTIQKTKT
jgi:uncharacterized protein YutE (UPF0331/DUF86 family)